LTAANTRTIDLLPHQFDLIEDTTTRILGLVSGYGGGKTYAVARKACTLALLNPGSDGIITEPNFPLLTQILIPEVEAALDEFGIPFHFNKSEMIFYCTAAGKQTRIICKSMERFDRLIGVNAAWVILDEFDTAKTNLAYSAFEKLMGRLRAGNVRQMVIVSTPEGFKAMYRIFVKDAGDGRRLIRARTEDNKYLPPDYIQSLKDTYPEELISAYLMGEFTNLTSGSVYNSYNRETNRSRETLQPGEPIKLGMDFNVGNMAACAYVLRENDWHCVDEIKGGVDTPSMIATMGERYEGHSVTIYPDASGKNTSSKGASLSDIGLLRQAGYAIRAKPSNPRVKDRVLAVNMGFQRGRVFVNPDTCPETARCLEQQPYNKQGEPDKTTGLDHQCFSGETMVFANGKQTRFDCIPERGTVTGPFGKEVQYVNGGLKREGERTLAVTLSNGYSFRVTLDHKILSSSGWVRADELTAGDILCSPSLSATPSKISTEQNTIFAETTFRQTVQGYTETFGRFITGLSQEAKIGTSTMLTTIGQTIMAGTLSLSLRRNTCATTTLDTQGQCPERPLKHQRYGTPAKRVLTGTENITRRLGQRFTQKPKTTHAHIAGVHSKATSLIEQCFADEIAGLLPAEHLVSTMKSEFALDAAKTLRSTDTNPQSIAVEVAQIKQGGLSDVYCITVPNHGCFDLGGVIVSNCDAFGYPMAYEMPVVKPSMTSTSLQF